MADLQALSIGAGIAQGIQDATKNMYAIMGVRHKLAQEKEAFDTDMKIKGLQLKKLESELDPEMLAFAKKKMKAESLNFDADYGKKIADTEKTYAEIDKLKRAKENDLSAFIDAMNKMRGGGGAGTNPSEVTLTYGGTEGAKGTVRYKQPDVGSAVKKLEDKIASGTATEAELLNYSRLKGKQEGIDIKTAINILSDPDKMFELKKSNPDLLIKLQGIVNSPNLSVKPKAIVSSQQEQPPQNPISQNQKYQIGQIVTRGDGKKFEIYDFDKNDGEPLVREIK